MTGNPESGVPKRHIVIPDQLHRRLKSRARREHKFLGGLAEELLIRGLNSDQVGRCLPAPEIGGMDHAREN